MSMAPGILKYGVGYTLKVVCQMYTFCDKMEEF